MYLQFQKVYLQKMIFQCRLQLKVVFTYFLYMSTIRLKLIATLDYPLSEMLDTRNILDLGAC